ncbi:shieldin complex subunit 1 isoform 3-T3 [Vipera latastei]
MLVHSSALIPNWENEIRHFKIKQNSLVSASVMEWNGSDRASSSQSQESSLLDLPGDITPENFLSKPNPEEDEALDLTLPAVDTALEPSSVCNGARGQSSPHCLAAMCLAVLLHVVRAWGDSPPGRMLTSIIRRGSGGSKNKSPSVNFSQGQLPKPTTLCGLVSMRGGGLPAARTRNSFNGAKLRFLSKGEKENPPLENLWTHSTVLCARRSQAEGVQYMNQLHSVCPLRLQILQAKRG